MIRVALDIDIVSRSLSVRVAAGRGVRVVDVRSVSDSEDSLSFTRVPEAREAGERSDGVPENEEHDGYEEAVPQRVVGEAGGHDGPAEHLPVGEPDGPEFADMANMRDELLRVTILLQALENDGVCYDDGRLLRRRPRPRACGRGA